MADRSCRAKLAFRRATFDDVPAVVALVESAYRGEASRAGWTTEADLLAGQRTDADEVRSIVESPSEVLLLAVEPTSDELVACCRLGPRADDVAHFGMFAVRPGLQGGGIGKQVLAEAERLARGEWNARVMEMSVIAQRVELIAWYERRGYSRTGETRPFPYGDPRFGEPRRPDLLFVVIVKALSSS